MIYYGKRIVLRFKISNIIITDKMSELALWDKLRQLSTQLMKLINLQNIDHHNSLTFLHKNYKIHPSQLITVLAMLLTLAILIVDGSNLIAGVVCFVLPLVSCIKELSVSEEKAQLNFVKINASDQNSRFTDEQFSQIVSSNKKHHTATQIYIVYFLCYAILEALTPFISWMVGSFSWLTIRCLFALAMLNKNVGGAVALLDLLRFRAPAHEPEWRGTQP